MAVNGATRLVVFDCDGTLVDSQHLIVEAMTRAFETADRMAPPAESIRRIVGLSLLHAMEVLAPEADRPAHEALVEGYREAFMEIRQRPDHTEVLYPGVHETLAHLEGAGWLLGVATGKSLRGMHATIARHGLDGRFVTIQTADIAPGKPHPGMLLQAMAEAGAAPETTVLVGDTSFDMEMARNAGVPAVGVAWGYHPTEELVQAGAHSVIERFDELHGLVDVLVT